MTNKQRHRKHILYVWVSAACVGVGPFWVRSGLTLSLPLGRAWPTGQPRPKGQTQLQEGRANTNPREGRANQNQRDGRANPTGRADPNPTRKTPALRVGVGQAQTPQERMAKARPSQKGEGRRPVKRKGRGSARPDPKAGSKREG